MKKTLVGFGLLILILWAQTGFDTDAIHLIYIFTNYGMWLILLPSLNGWVRSTSEIGWLNASIQLSTLLLLQWIGSNILLYILRHFILGDPLIPSGEELNMFLFPSIISRIIDLAVLVGSVLWMHQNRQLAEKKLEIVEKEANFQRNKLKALKNQLNPHFLFNTMHGISSLIGHDNDKAQKLTIQTSNLLRQMLAINDLENHTLKEEWAFVSNYLDIESERFSDRLEVKVNIEPEMLSFEVPTMILQPLIENAFKHGISKRTGFSVLQIEMKIHEGFVQLLVINDLPSNINSPQSTGVGLKNLEARLVSSYPSASLKHWSDEQCYYSQIKIPIS